MSRLDATILGGLTRGHTLSLLKSGKYSDFTITCGGQDFKVHKCIITDSSEYFRAAVDGGFSESSSNRLVLEETTPEAVAVTVVWMYTDYDLLPQALDVAYSVYSIKSGNDAEELAILLDTYLLADRLMLDQLKDEADRGAGKKIQLIRDDVEDGVADIAELSSLVKMVYEKIPDTDSLLRPNLTSFLVTDARMPHNLPAGDHGEHVDLTGILALVKEHDRVGLKVGKSLLEKLRIGDIGFNADEGTYTSLHNWR